MESELQVREKWEHVPLGSICNITSSKRIFAKEYTSSGIPFYRGKEIIEKHKGNHVSTELFISPERFYEIQKKFGAPQIGDILLTSVGTLGVSWLVDETDFYFKDGNLTWLRSGDRVLSKYLYLWLNSPDAQRQIDAKCIGSTQKALTIETLNKFQIALPPLSVQKQICSVLYPILDKIELNQKINENLERQAQAIFQQMFPYTVTDALPDGWRVGTVGEIVELHDAKRIPLSGTVREQMKSKTYPYYGAASLMDYVDDYIFDGKYLLLGEDGTVVDAAGYPVLQYVWGKFWVNNHAHILTGKQGFNIESLYLLFRQTPVKSIVTGAVQPKISQANLRSIQVTIPPEDRILSFNGQIEPLFSQIRLNEEQNTILNTLKNTLLPKLMAGEIEVSDIQL